MEPTVAADANVLTIFDWVVISVVGLSAVLALFRGFVREILSLTAWFIAAFVTVNYYEQVSKMLEAHVSSGTARLGLSTIGLFLAVLLVTAIVNSIIMRFLKAGGDLSILDSLMGMLFGVLRGVFIVSLAYLMFSVVFEKEFPDWLEKAKTRPIASYGATVLAKLAPKYTKNLGVLSKEAAEKGQQIKDDEKHKQFNTPHAPSKGPENYDQKQMERLLDGVEGKAATSLENN